MGAPFRLTAPSPRESDIQRAVLRLLAVDRRVAWSGRFNSGAVSYPAVALRDPQFVRFHTVPGFADIAGQLRDGVSVLIECKRAGERLEPHQFEFLATALWGRAVAGVARSVDDAIALLDGDWEARMRRLEREAVAGQGRAREWPQALRLPRGFREWFRTTQAPA